MTTTVSIDSTQPQPELEAYVLLRQINAMLETCSRYDLRDEDLTVPQFAILNHATREGVPLSEISARMLCDNSNLTGIVDRLISKNYVERRPDPQDRRVSLICLTPTGAEKLRAIRPRHHESVSQRMQSLSDEQVAVLRDLLRDLHQGLEGAVEDTRLHKAANEARAGRKAASRRTSGRAARAQARREAARELHPRHTPASLPEAHAAHNQNTNGAWVNNSHNGHDQESLDKTRPL